MPAALRPQLHCMVTTSTTWEVYRALLVTVDRRALIRSRTLVQHRAPDYMAKPARQAAQVRPIVPDRHPVSTRREADADTPGRAKMAARLCEGIGPTHRLRAVRVGAIHFVTIRDHLRSSRVRLHLVEQCRGSASYGQQMQKQMVTEVALAPDDLLAAHHVTRSRCARLVKHSTRLRHIINITNTWLHRASL